MAKYDKEIVRQAATGRWKEILESVGGMSRDVLDNGCEHPCPKCGGNTRFRLVDESAGAVFCNHCFNEKNGDGFAAVGWMLGIDFAESLAKVAEYVGVQPEKTVKKKTPFEYTELIGWAEQIANVYISIRGKKGVKITQDALHEAGVVRVKHSGKFYLAAQVFDQEANTPFGYAMFDPYGKLISTKRGAIKYKTVKDKKHPSCNELGLMGKHAIDRLKTKGLVEVLWKVEGVSDLIAMQAIIPKELKEKHVVITNSNGTSQKPRWMADLHAPKTYVLHDADKPGQGGAVVWANAYSRAGAKEVKLVELPYEVTDDHGKDVSDYLAEGHCYSDLLALADTAQQKTLDDTPAGTADENSDMDTARNLCSLLKFEVMGEMENGNVKLFSFFHRKTDVIDPGRLTYCRLLQICGPVVKKRVHQSKEDLPGMHPLNDVKNAIALIAGGAKIEPGKERGAGVWLSPDESAVVLVNSGEASRWNGDKTLRRVITPRSDGLQLDLGCNYSWYDHEQMQRDLHELDCGTDFGRDCLNKLKEYLGMWAWQNGDIDVQLCAGLVMATFIQSVWHWRPLVAVTGKTNSGKSYLFEFLGGEEGLHDGIYGAQAFKQSKSTEAGLRQGINNTSAIILCDEFEQSKERQKILNSFKNSSRGEQTRRGTSDQKGTGFVLRHIPWVAAIEPGLIESADRNRFCVLTLVEPEAGELGKLVLPSSSERKRLGQCLLATAVWYAKKARKKAHEIKGMKFDGIDRRFIESYAVPATMLVMAEHGVDAPKEIYKEKLQYVLENAVLDEPEMEGDEERLLDYILSCRINCGHRGNLSVGKIISDFICKGGEDINREFSDRIESIGIRVMKDESIFIATGMITGMLSKSDWSGRGIKRLLMRIDDAKSCQRRINKRNVNGVLLPPMIDDEEEQEEDVAPWPEKKPVDDEFDFTNVPF